MLTVKTPDEVFTLISESFQPISDDPEYTEPENAVGRVLAQDIYADEYVPDFDRSTVDGYAVKAADTFGCSDAIPAVLTLKGSIAMGERTQDSISDGECFAIPTGGAVPQGADCCVMIEYTEDYGDGSIGIAKSAAPGANMIFRGDDVCPGKKILSKGRVISSQDVGALAAAGIVSIPVVRRIKVGIISTGDELVPASGSPTGGQMRDANGPMLCAMLSSFGAQCTRLGICPDDEAALESMVKAALAEHDAVIISGGSSVGAKDASLRAIESLGEVLLHGIAMKPGKPTIIGRAGSKALIGLPGHPVAAYFTAKLFVRAVIARMEGRAFKTYSVPAALSESVSANHGRAQYVCAKLTEGKKGLLAVPVRTKSGLITNLADTDGFFCIDCDCEGLPAGAAVNVTLCIGE